MVKDYLLTINKYQESALLKAMRAFALTNDYPIISIEGIGFLKQIIKMTNTKRVLEIGSCICYSAIAIAELDVNVTTIEINKNTYDIARKYLDQSGLKSKVNLIQGDALTIDFRLIEEEFDLIFIDAAKAQYIKFFDRFTPLLRHGGVVFTDNLLFHNLVVAADIPSKNLRQLVDKIKKFNDYISDKVGFDSIIYPIGDGIAVSIKEGVNSEDCRNIR